MAAILKPTFKQSHRRPLELPEEHRAGKCSKTSRHESHLGCGQMSSKTTDLRGRDTEHWTLQTARQGELGSSFPLGKYAPSGNAVREGPAVHCTAVEAGPSHSTLSGREGEQRQTNFH